jgi:tetratricopeptide (TPR) repeat protein
MPRTTYMQRHPRHDHGFTVPDPLLTKRHGVPNACNRCHTDRDADWSLRAVEEWYGERMERRSRRRALAIAGARRGDDGALAGLLDVAAKDPSPLWRAVGLGCLDPWLGRSPEVQALALRSLAAEDPLVRAAALRLLEPRALELRPRIEPLVADPVRLVRLDAAWALRRSLDLGSSAGKELHAYLLLHSDQPTGAYRLGVFFQDRGERHEARRWMRHALRLDPSSALLMRALASVERDAGDKAAWLTQLRKAHDEEPKDAQGAFELALALAELADDAAAAGRADAAVEKLREAAGFLERACALDASFARAWYNLALARSRLDAGAAALEALDRAEALEPENPDFAYARISILRAQGRLDDALAALRQLEGLRPRSAEVLRLRVEILRETGDEEGARRAWEELLRAAGENDGDR